MFSDPSSQMHRAVPRVSAKLVPPVCASSALVAASRGVSQFVFGQKPMPDELIPRNQFQPYKPAKDAGVEVTVLGNGARLVTHNQEGAHAAVGIYAEAGAKYDPRSAPGLSYVMRWALMNSNFENSLFQIDRTIRSAGAAFEHQEIRKRFVGWKIEARGDSWKKPAENLVIGMAVPRFPEYDVERFRDTMDNLLEEQRWQRPREYAVDMLETVAFNREPLGNSRMVLPLSNGECSHDKLVAQWEQLCVPSRIIIAGINVPHSDLLAVYENSPYQHSATAPHHARAAAVPKLDVLSEATQYRGGSDEFEQESRAKAMSTKPNMEKETIAAVGFRSFGRDVNIKQYAASLVLQQLADVASADGIRYDRYDSHHGIRTFYRPYSGAGLIGFTVRAAPDKVVAEIAAGVALWRGLSADAEAVNAAVQRAAVRFYHDNVEYARDYLDFVASSLAAAGTTHTTAAEVLKAINEVTPADVQRALDIVKSDRPCLFATGETLGMPSLRQMGL